MGLRLMAAALAFAALAAGCIDAVEPAASAPAPEPTTPRPAFADSVVATEGCIGSCFETTIAADPEGRLFATGGIAGPMGVSEDGGATWRALEPPPLPDGVPADVVRADVLLQTDPEGRLYWSALVLQRTPALYTLLGIQVARTDDAGGSWAINAYHDPVQTPGAAIVFPDRQWLGFGPQGEVYLTYNQIPSGIWFARSDDGGATFEGWTRAAPVEGRNGGIGQSGPPVADSQGRIFVAATSTATGTMRVFASEDGGASWQSVDVQATPGRGGSWFPILAVDAQDRLHIAMHYGGDVVVATSEDAGRTWSEGVTWGKGAATSPWIVPTGGDGLALMWYESSNGGSVVHFVRGTLAGPEETTVVVDAVDGGKGTNTDFAHFALLPDGRAALVWSDGDEAEARVAVETP